MQVVHYTAVTDMVTVKGSTHTYIWFQQNSIKKSGKNGELYELCIWYFHIMDYLG
jgi:hypothetical protein